jgi:hypothetical protein
MSKIDVEDAQRLREAYSNLLKEVESNQIIASPAANTKGCKSRLRVSGYESVQKDLVSFPQDLARKIRLVYRDIAQENQYIEKIERMGFDKFRQEFPMEWLQWSRTCIILVDSLKDLQIALKSKLESIPSLPK